MNFESCIDTLLANLKLNADAGFEVIADRVAGLTYRITWLEAELAHMRKVAKGQESEIKKLKEQLREIEYEKGMLSASNRAYLDDLGKGLDRERELKAELAVERKKWPDMKAEVERLKKLVNDHEATISLFGTLIKHRLSAKVQMCSMTTGAEAHIAPDVREALDRLVQDATANGPYVAQLRERIQSLEMLVSNGTKDFNDQVRKTVLATTERDELRAERDRLRSDMSRQRWDLKDKFEKLLGLEPSWNPSRTESELLGVLEAHLKHLNQDRDAFKKGRDLALAEVETLGKDRDAVERELVQLRMKYLATCRDYDLKLYAAEHVQVVAAPPPVATPITRDQVRLALLDYKPAIAQFTQGAVNDLADHLVDYLVKKLT